METPRLVARVARFSARENLFRRTRRVLLAVSGGPDSLAALVVLRQLAPRVGFELTVAHFDHQLRPDSRADLEFVRAICERFGVPFLSGEGDVRAAARQQQKGIEETARLMRYQFLAFVAGEKHIDAIATGHTEEDQAETVVLRMLRGAGVRGIRGMLPSSGVPGSPAQRLIRPLLVLTRAQTAAICREAGIEPRFDPSNADVSLLRNRVRHEVLPTLAAVNPSVRGALVRLAVSAREAFTDIERQALAAAPASRGPSGSVFAVATLAALPAEALTLVIEREAAFHKLDIDVNRTRLLNLRQVLGRREGEVRFGAIAVQCSAGLVRLGPLMAAREPLAARILDVPGVTAVGPWRVTVATSPLPIDAGAVACIDRDALQGALRARPLVAGDRMRYHGMERKVADVFAAAKVPVWDRAVALAVADATMVRAVIAGGAAFDAGMHGEDALWVRVAGR